MPADLTTAAKKQPWRVILVFAGVMTGAIAMLTSPARADTIIFNDLTESPTLTHIGNATTVTGSCSGSEDCIIRVSRPDPLQAVSLSPGSLITTFPEPILNLAEDAQKQFFSDQVAIDLLSGPPFFFCAD
jgi:hypothetical protein